MLPTRRLWTQACMHMPRLWRRPTTKIQSSRLKNIIMKTSNFNSSSFPRRFGRRCGIFESSSSKQRCRECLDVMLLLSFKFFAVILDATFCFLIRGSHTQRGSIEIPSLIIRPSVQHDTRVQYAVSARLSKSVWPANQSIPVTHYTMSQQYATPPPCSTGVNVGRRGNGTGLLTFLIGLITTLLPYVGITWKKCSRTSIITKRNTNWDGTEWVSTIYIYIYSIMEYAYIPRVRACVRACVRGSENTNSGLFGQPFASKTKKPLPNSVAPSKISWPCTQNEKTRVMCGLQKDESWKPYLL